MLDWEMNKTGESRVDDASIFDPRRFVPHTAQMEIQAGVTALVIAANSNWILHDRGKRSSP